MNKTANSPNHWAAHNERGSRFFLRLTAHLACHCPPSLLRLCIYAVLPYFFLTAPHQRRCIRDYQTRLRRRCPDVSLPKQSAVWRQFLAFAEAITDRFSVWQHKITYADLNLYDPDDIYADIRRSIRERQHGQIFICAHLGNTEICRALVHHHQGFVLNVLVHSRHAQAFNQALKEAGADDIHLIQVTDLDAALMLDLQKRLERGEWLAIAADRIPVRGDKTTEVLFLGESAQLPQGPWLLAGLLKAPLNTVFCLKKQNQYELHLKKFAGTPQWQRTNRQEKISELAQNFADELTAMCRLAPLQWFNFYDFWNQHAPH
ncbi:glycosyl transferase family 2 [Stenoxybacter acetivorans]|uniref:LpxL/LpxP family acyltransferase n=1 Tax=Stenoxybacter acetivorans TaxID=422441 RepID=UPI0005628A05|nr:glycosyl transferase family 2 [Stenoxybacter acetivorans]